ncbi:MAG TPA: hypothetical protein VEJ89_07430 [Myxococcaceae bacterium]|nr:hypothetical protein [Myxococcaceae bacterium]
MHRPGHSVVWLAVGAAALAGLARCSFGIDPDTGHFACAVAADCGGGQWCVVPTDGGSGYCYPTGQCAPEDCSIPQCLGESCVADGGPEKCVERVLLPDGGVVDAGTPADGGTDAGMDAGQIVYGCGLP